MTDSLCNHYWKIVNLRSGYIVTEGCYHCGGRASFFTLEDRHHKDIYADGEHRWRFLGSSQAVKFDLECSKCGDVVKLDRTVALMLCTECRDDCEVVDAKEKGDDTTWIYVALCADSLHRSKECVTPEEIDTLSQYFNSRIKTPGKKVVFVPCIRRKTIDLCQGEVIADVGMKEIY